MSKVRIDVTGHTHSDDCATWSTNEADEYDNCDNWCPVYLGDKLIGQVRFFYGDGWETQFQSDDPLTPFRVGEPAMPDED